MPFPPILFNSFDNYHHQIALVEAGMAYSYADLLQEITSRRTVLKTQFEKESVVCLQGDFSLSSIAWLFALLAENFVVYLRTATSEPENEIASMAGLHAIIRADNDTIIKVDTQSVPNLITDLLNKKEPGIIFLSSGSSGKPKMILHAAHRLMQKFTQSKKAYRTLGFLLFDHIAGFDTLMYTLHAGGTLVIVKNRSVDNVLSLLKENNVAVLPTSPSYLNLLLMNPQFSTTHLPELKIITFGSERINDITLARLQERFKGHVRCEQKYGLTELGSLVIRSNPDDPSWIQLDDRFANWRVEDDCLWIKTNSALLGYIHPDREEVCSGWFYTGDKVEQNGSWIKILGRETDLINVGGQKVYPAEVESVLQAIDNVLQVVVSGANHPLMGQVVSAKFQILQPEAESEFRKRMRLFCKDKLAAYKIPVFISLQQEPIMTERFKVSRVS